MKFTPQDVKEGIKTLGIDLKKEGFSFKQLLMGANVELEHGSKWDETNITDDDIIPTMKIAWAHLKELPDYYTRLENMEQKGKEYWDALKEKKSIEYIDLAWLEE